MILFRFAPRSKRKIWDPVFCALKMDVESGNWSSWRKILVWEQTFDFKPRIGFQTKLYSNQLNYRDIWPRLGRKITELQMHADPRGVSDLVQTIWPIFR